MTSSNRNIERNGISVCALVPYPPNTTPSQRYRIEQWLPYLHEKGIAVELLPFVNAKMMEILHQPVSLPKKASHFAKAFLRRCLAIAKISRYDAVFIHRAACIAGPAWLERLIQLFNCPIIYDFDDAIFQLHTTEANRHFGWLKFPGKTATICVLSSHVVVGNAYLADYARQFNPNVSIIPSSVDTEQYQASDERKESNHRVVIGWTGSSTSQTHLEWFAPVLRELIKQREVEIRVISNREPVLPGIPYQWQPWSAESEVEDLRPFDIGIMPMPDDEWARGKCAMKALLYMAMGIPTVCSAVGTNLEVIRHGENGFLAKTNDEWLGCLKALIDDAALRRRLGAAGRRTVENRYSMQHCAAQFANVVRETVESHKLQTEIKRWSLQKSKSSAR